LYFEKYTRDIFGIAKNFHREHYIVIFYNLYNFHLMKRTYLSMNLFFLDFLKDF